MSDEIEVHVPFIASTEYTKSSAHVCMRDLKFTAHISRIYEQEFLASADVIGETIRVRLPLRLRRG